MPRFAFEAAGSDGAIGRGVIEAATRSAAAESILAQGRTPLRIVEQDGAGAAWRGGERGFARWGVDTRRLSLLQQLGVLLEAGLTVERALRTLLGLATSASAKSEITNILEGLQAGGTLSTAMARADGLFPEWLRRLVSAGEASGRLAEVVNRIAEAEARRKDLADRAVSAMVYPALLVVVMIAVLAMIFTLVVPRLEPLFAQTGDALPWPTALLVGTAHLFEAYGSWIGVALIAAFVLALYATRRPTLRLALDRWAINSRLLFDIPRRYQAAQVARNLAMVLEGGLALNRALEAAQAAVTNGHFRRQLSRTLETVREGGALKRGLEAAQVFPPEAVELAAVGEETGRLSSMLKKAADMLDRDVQRKLDRLSALLLPAVTIVLGLVVAIIMSGVVSGILAANDMAL